MLLTCGPARSGVLFCSGCLYIDMGALLHAIMWRLALWFGDDAVAQAPLTSTNQFIIRAICIHASLLDPLLYSDY